MSRWLDDWKTNLAVADSLHARRMFCRSLRRESSPNNSSIGLTPQISEVPRLQTAFYLTTSTCGPIPLSQARLPKCLQRAARRDEPLRSPPSPFDATGRHPASSMDGNHATTHLLCHRRKFA